MLYLKSVLVYFIVVIVYLSRATSRQVIDPNKWFVIIFSFLLVVHFTFDVKYAAGNKYSALPYFLICFFSILWGTKVGFRTACRKSFRSVSKIGIGGLAYISFISSLFLVVDIIRNNSLLTLGTRIEDFQISIIGLIANLFSGLGLVPWLAYLYRFLMRGGKMPVCSFLSLFAFLSYDIVTGGRQTLFASVISSIVMVAWCLKRKKELKIQNKIRIPKSFYFVLVLLLSYFLIVSSVRTVVLDTDERISSLEYVFSADIGDETEELINKLGPLSSIYTEFGLYYSHELNRLDILLKYYKEPVYFFPFEMSYISRRIPVLAKEGDRLWKSQEYIFGSKVDFYAHTWSTFLGNYYVNYGLIGSVFACFITGLIMGRFRKRFDEKHKLVLLIRLCTLIGGIFIAIEFSPFSQMTWFVCMLFTSLFDVKMKGMLNEKENEDYPIVVN